MTVQQHIDYAALNEVPLSGASTPRFRCFRADMNAALTVFSSVDLTAISPHLCGCLFFSIAIAGLHPVGKVKPKRQSHEHDSERRKTAGLALQTQQVAAYIKKGGLPPMFGEWALAGVSHTFCRCTFPAKVAIALSSAFTKDIYNKAMRAPPLRHLRPSTGVSLLFIAVVERTLIGAICALRSSSAASIQLCLN